MMWKTGILAGFSAAILIAACAYPEVNYRDPDKTSSSSRQSSSVTSGPGGMGGSGGATVTTSTTATGGAGGGGPAECVLLGDASQCPSNQKCSLEIATGKIQCLTKGTKERWEKCFTDADCDANLWCDLYLQVCKPVCFGAGNCTEVGEGECVSALNSMGQAIPGIRHCTSNCQPWNGKPCAVTDGVTCVMWAQSEFDCAVSGGKGQCATCTADVQCAVEMACVQDGSESKCKRWCDDVGPFPSSCGFASNCYGLNPKTHHGSSEVGVCNDC
ncbi:MAG: hypothetical protein VB934_23285 [Polyangiaceae bacterium]